MTPQRRSAILSAPLKPTWSWDFTRGALPPGAIFSRTSAATQFDASGTLCWAPENRIAWSQDFSQPIWGKYAGGTGSAPVVTQNDATTLAPDGTQTAAKVVFACGGGTTSADQSLLQYSGGSNSVVIGRAYTGFLRVKAAGGTQLVFRHVGLATYTLFTATGGWDTLAADEAAGGIQLNFEIGIRQGLVGTLGANATAWVWGAQVHGKPNADATYHPTAGGIYYGHRFDHDPLTGAPLGYLAEMQSTNNVPYSSDGSHWTLANAAQATDGTPGPDGVTLARKITASAGNAQHYCQISGGVAGSTAIYGYSLFVKQGNTRYAVIVTKFGVADHALSFDFQTGALNGSGQNLSSFSQPRQMANGWWRLSYQASISSGSDTGIGVSFTPNNATDAAAILFAAAGTEYGYCTGKQIEPGGVGATSYIPTSGAATTRSADNLALPLSALPGWNGGIGGAFASAGRLYTVYPPTPGFNQMPIWINNAGDYRNAVAAEFDNGGSGQRGVFMFSGGAGAVIGSTFGAVPAPFVRSKMAVGWQANRIAGACDGANGYLQSGTLALPVGLTVLNIGLYLGSHAFGGAIESIAYYAGARPDALVQRASR